MKPYVFDNCVISISQSLEFSVSFTTGYFDIGTASSSNKHTPVLGSYFLRE